jgi:septum formation protein
MPANFVFLASLSPRRRELLSQIGVSVRLLEVRVDETSMGGEEPGRYVTRVARAKADAGWACRDATTGAPVLGADTAVILDGAILGKPKDRSDAAAMLERLSGRSHQVLTAVALRSDGGVESRLSRSVVSLRAIGAAEAQRYWETGEPRDKAGGYGIQGYGAVFVADLHGSYSGVMGLPLYETTELLDAVGVPRWTSSLEVPGRLQAPEHR